MTFRHEIAFDFVHDVYYGGRGGQHPEPGFGFFKAVPLHVFLLVAFNALNVLGLLLGIFNLNPSIFPLRSCFLLFF